MIWQCGEINALKRKRGGAAQACQIEICIWQVSASCECGYVLDTPTHASGRDRNHRFTCHASACLLRRDPHLA
jgi:hypothetical protein